MSSRHDDNRDHYRAVRTAWAVVGLIVLMFLTALGYYWSLP